MANMINMQVGDISYVPDLDLWRTFSGAPIGHAVYGPYETKTHGVYEVDFRLSLAEEAGERDAVCAVLDVAAQHGGVSLARQAISCSDLGGEPRTFSLLFVLRRIEQLEYRVFVTGAADLLIDGKPTVRRISGILDEEPRRELGLLADDLERCSADTRRILRHLRPYALQGCGKIRMGRENDGGYVCPDDFTGLDTAFSFGINDDISWDRDAADRGLTIYQFDHTVADPAPGDPRMIFEAKRIDAVSGPETQSLGDLVRRHDKGMDRPNLILKMDIEGGEWPVLDATPPEELARLAWIACELHYFQGLAELQHRQMVDRCLTKLGKLFFVAHVHSNVWGGYTSIANVVLPNVIEVLFVNRSLYHADDSLQIFPTPLDQSCDPTQPDFYLSAFAY